MVVYNRHIDYGRSRDDMTGFLFDMVRPEEMIRAITIDGSL